ncbi:hypothetical protein PMAYCL1PPCAC_13956, partial [Pristionchus mayeri]
SENSEAKKRRRSSRIVLRKVKHSGSGEESDEDMGPIVKKGRSKSVEKKRNKSSKGTIRSKTMKNDNENKDSAVEKKELKCPECEYSSGSAISWCRH